MIHFAGEKEFEQIVSLWEEAFGDSREWVMMYLSENIKNVLVYSEDSVVMGMLSLLEIFYKGRKGYYIYGVATRKAYRSKGISTKLLDFAKNIVKEKSVDFLVLVPRNQGLFDFYAERGFSPVASVETKEYTRDALLEKCCGCRIYPASPAEYFDIRKNHFDNLIEWDEEMLGSIKRLENGRYYKTDNGDGAFCYEYDGKLYVKELCGDMWIAAEIMKKTSAIYSFVTVKNENKLPSCMVYPTFSEEVFFNIAID